jgi:hypothetical protein
MTDARSRRFGNIWWKEADAQICMVGQVLENVAVTIGKAADHLEKAPGPGK